MKLLKLRDHPGELDQAAKWFHEKWNIPEEEYANSMAECVRQGAGVPQWYLMAGDTGEILGGAGVIENDFHDRPDLTPNLCALFVEEPYRRQGIARRILDSVRADCGGMGIEKLYLVTEHTQFYEKCGWEFLTLVRDQDGTPMRMYAASCEK